MGKIKILLSNIHSVLMVKDKIITYQVKWEVILTL